MAFGQLGTLGYSFGTLGSIARNVSSLSLVPFVIFNGESNSGGAAPNSGGPGVTSPTTAELLPRTNLLILNNTTMTFQPMQIGVNNLIGHSLLTDNATHGWENELANAADAGRFNQVPLYLLKTGQGGSIISQWSVGNASGYWATFLTRYNATTALFASAGLTPVPIIFYSQGINDGIASTPVATWVAATQAHFAKLRALIGANTRIIMTKFTGFPAFNAGMDTIVAADPLTTAVSGEDSLLQPDGFHWTYFGYREIAEVMIDAWLAPNGVAAAPTILPVAGLYVGAQSVTISGPGSLKYSTTVDDPHIGTAYSGAFSVTPPLTVSVRSIVQNLASGFASAAYTSTDSWNTTDAAAGGFVLTNGNLNISHTGADAWTTTRGVNSASSGLLYFEYKVTTGGNAGDYMLGLASSGFAASSYLGTSNYSLGMAIGGVVYTHGFTAGTGVMPTAQAVLNDVWGLAVNFTTGKVWVSRNNTWLAGDPASGTSPQATFTPATVGALFPAISMFDTGGLNGTWTMQATSASQTYTPPSGFSAWN